MDERPTLPTDRRRLLKGLGFAAGGWFLPEDLLQDQSFVLEQGGECYPVEPLSGQESPAAFYDYRTGRGSRGTTDLQREDTSILFLYRGPERLSLVVVHGKMGGRSDGGAATFRLTGLPEDGEWVVRDDDYDGSSQKDNWNVSNGTSTVDWTWVGSLTDGGVFAGLGDDFEVEINPRFNDEADLSDRYGGTVTSWELLSGDTDDPERTELDMSEPVTIRTGTCDGGLLDVPGGESEDEPNDDDDDEPGRRRGQDGGEPGNDDPGPPGDDEDDEPGRRRGQDDDNDEDDPGPPGDDEDDEPGRRRGQDDNGPGNDDPGPPGDDEDDEPGRRRGQDDENNDENEDENGDDDDDEGLVSVEADEEGVGVDVDLGGEDDEDDEDDD